MNKIKYILIFMTLFLVTASSIFAGGGNRVGTAGASELLIPVGARGIAMGGATVTNSFGADAIFWNPANISRGQYGVDIMASHMTYIADMNVIYAAVAAKVGDLGTIALSLKSLDIGEIMKTTQVHPDGTGLTFEPQYVTFGVSYSKLLSDRISVGINCNFVSEKIEFVEASGVAFDIGVTYSNLASIKGLTLAILMKNLGGDMQFDGSGVYTQAELVDSRRTIPSLLKIDTAPFELPTTYEVGLGYDYAFDETNKITIAGLFKSHNFYEDEYKIGVEYAFNNLLFIRGGYTYAPQFDIEGVDPVFGITGGLGLNYEVGDMAIKVDYAYRPTEYFDDNHVITIGLGL